MHFHAFSWSSWLAAWLAGACVRANEFAQHGGHTPEIGRSGHLTPTCLILDVHASLRFTCGRNLWDKASFFHVELNMDISFRLNQAIV